MIFPWRSGSKPDPTEQRLLDAFEEVFFEVFGGNGRIIPHEVIPLAAETVDEAENTEGAGAGSPAALTGMTGGSCVTDFE